MLWKDEPCPDIENTLKLSHEESPDIDSPEIIVEKSLDENIAVGIESDPPKQAPFPINAQTTCNPPTISPEKVPEVLREKRSRRQPNHLRDYDLS